MWTLAPGSLLSPFYKDTLALSSEGPAFLILDHALAHPREYRQRPIDHGIAGGNRGTNDGREVKRRPCGVSSPRWIIRDDPPPAGELRCVERSWFISPRWRLAASWAQPAPTAPRPPPPGREEPLPPARKRPTPQRAGSIRAVPTACPSRRRTTRRSRRSTTSGIQGGTSVPLRRRPACIWPRTRSIQVSPSP